MKQHTGTKKTGKLLLYISSILAGIFSMGFVFGAWIMVRPGRKRDYDCIGRVSFGKIEALSLKTEDGLLLHAWAQRTLKQKANRWVVLLHGYRSDRQVLHTRRRFFVRRGYNVLLLHFRGHGSSDSANISYGFNERKDVKAAVDYIRTTYPERPLEIGIDGVSMGAAAAAFAVAYESIKPDWVILESCYDNIDHALVNRLKKRISAPLVPAVAFPLEFVGKHLFQLPLEELNPTRALEKIHCPVLVLAGDSELVLKASEVEALFKHIPEPKRLEFFPGATHEDLLLHDPRRFIKTVNQFLREFSLQQVTDREVAEN
jgi:pimeloyl-ACP methyl ester carboxylesterase